MGDSMSTIINATTTNGVVIQPDNSGSLVLQTNNGTTALTLDTSQNATFAGKVTSAGALTLASNGTTTAVTIDTSQNVGIGTASPAKKLTVNTAGVSGAMLRLTDGVQQSFDIESDVGAAGAGIISYNTVNGGQQVFKISNTERMRIDSSGNVLVGTTGISTGSFKGFQNAAGGADANYLSRNSSGTANRQWSFGMNSQDQYVVYGYNTTSFNTGAYIAWGGTSWTASSDERLKDIIEPITDAVNKVSTLRTVIGKYKTDEEGTRRAFLIAQDVQKVLPEAVDASNPEKLGIAYTDVIPLLVAAIKEQQTIINDLKARIETLEAK
jgi:hypothetical protein